MGHPVYESIPAFVADVSRKLHHHSEKLLDDDGNKPPPPSPARRVLGKARAVVVFLYIAAKKKCIGPKDGRQTMPADYDQIGEDKSSPSSPVQRALGKARAVIVLSFLAAKQKLDVRAKDGREGMKEAPEVDAGSESICGGCNRSTPTTTTVRRALRKARAAVVSPFHAAKKKADGKEQSEHAEEEMPASKSMSVCSGGKLSPSRRHSSLQGAVRTVMLYPFLHARKKKHATAAEDEETTIQSETAEEAEHDLATSPSSTHSTPSSLGTKSAKATPTRSPKALLRKVRAATVLLPFHSRKKPSEQSTSVEEEDLPPTQEGASFEGVVWKKTILMGQKCEPLDFPGVIYYDSKGERLDGVPPRSAMSTVQQQLGNSFTEQHQQHVLQSGFSFPVLVAGSGLQRRGPVGD